MSSIPIKMSRPLRIWRNTTSGNVCDCRSKAKVSYAPSGSQTDRIRFKVSTTCSSIVAANGALSVKMSWTRRPSILVGDEKRSGTDETARQTLRHKA